MPTYSFQSIARNHGREKIHDGNGGYWEKGYLTELVTLSTSSATKDTTANLLPSNSLIEAVTARVTTTIATATDWKLGDSVVSGRFTAASTSLTAGSTIVGLVHIDQTSNSSPRQTAAAPIRVTCSGTPSAGAIRITSYYRQFVAPTS